MFRMEIGRGEGGGAGVAEHPQKNATPTYFCITEGSNFKFGTQRGFGKYVIITALVPNLVGADWSTGAPQKLCGPGTMYPVPRNSCRNVIKLQI